MTFYSIVQREKTSGKLSRVLSTRTFYLRVIKKCLMFLSGLRVNTSDTRFKWNYLCRYSYFLRFLTCLLVLWRRHRVLYKYSTVFTNVWFILFAGQVPFKRLNPSLDLNLYTKCARKHTFQCLKNQQNKPKNLYIF